MSSEWWDDFFNNLATDLAPLVSLFGESPTKQFLSESVSLIDIFIFAMAPLGIITILVSAIRVGGSPSLRAFIGRAQEGGGNIEAELCSSTSRDVCELYNNGGIARVFGRPKILEIVHDPQADKKDFYGLGGKEKSAGIYSFEEYIKSGKADREWDNCTGILNMLPRWKRLRAEPESARSLKETVSDSDFAPHPNLSLNVGIKKRSSIWFLLAAASGLLLQSGVLLFAGLSVFAFSKRFQKNDKPADAYAFPFTLAGTLLLCTGVGMCGHIVERSTKERRFRRKSAILDNDSGCRFFWIQPGNQVIGDQVFDPFAYNETPESSIPEYITSMKDTQDKELQRKSTLLVWVFVPVTLFGFVLQFIGLRALHSTISIAQLGATVLMSIIRSILRSKRLRKEDNRLGDDPDLFQGHELDWLALELCKDHPKTKLTAQQAETQRHVPTTVLPHVSDNNNNSTYIWQLTSSPTCPRASFSEQLYVLSPTKEIRTVSRSIQNEDAAIVLLSVRADRKPNQWLAVIQQKDVTGIPRLVPRIFLSRARIARMTGVDPILGSSRGDSSQWTEDVVPTRVLAATLTDAFRRTVDVLFSNYTTPPVLKDGWVNASTIFVALDCSVATLPISDEPMHHLENPQRDMIYTALWRTSTDKGEIDGQWNSDASEIEAILSLWTWSLKARSWGTAKISNFSALPKKLNFERLKSTRLLFVSEAETDGAANSNIALHQSTLSPWLGDLGTEVRRARLSYPATSGFDPTWVWTRTADVTKQTSDQTAYTPMALYQLQHCRPTDSNDWFFGWDVFHSPTPPQKQSPRDLDALITRTDNSPAVMCAQDIYTKLFRNLLSILEDIGGETKVMKGRHGFYLANDNITEIIRAFADSGLGSENEARACIIPTLLEKEKLPVVSMVAQARNLGDEYRKEGAWKKAEEVLRWALDISLQSWKQCQSGSEEQGQEAGTASEDLESITSSTDPEQELWLCVVTLCECYRWALCCEGKHSGYRQFGVEGIIEMLKLRQTLPHLADTLDIYGKAALRIAKETLNVLAVHDITHLEQTLEDYETSPNTRSSNSSQGGDDSSIEGHEFRQENPHENIISAIKAGDMISALYHLRGPSAIQEDHEGRSSLSLAAEEGWFIVVKSLIEVGAIVRQSDTLARTPLHLAVFSGNKTLVRYLLDQGMDINSRDANHHTSLLFAAKHGRYEICKMLLRVGANVSDVGSDGATVLHLAASSGNGNLVTYFLEEQDLDVDTYDNHWRTPLHTAAALQLTDIVEQLLRYGANPNIRVYSFDTNVELLKLLWEKMKEPGFGLDKNNCDFVGRAIDLECLDIIKWIGAQSEFVISAFYLVKTMGPEKTAIFQELLSSPNTEVNGQGISMTPLTGAVMNGLIEVVQMLLADPRVDIDLRDGLGRTPAEWAEEKGRVEILELIDRERERRQIELTPEPTGI